MEKPAIKKLVRLSAELKRRRVYPVVAAYAVVAWVLLQVGEVTFGPLGMPDWLMTALVVAVIAGFPITVVLAWVFDVHTTPALPEIPSLDSLQPSVAVLPFSDLSPEKDQSYFCEGIAEEILNALTTIPGLRVAARMSSFQFRDQAIDVREVGRRLGVRAVLEGSVRKYQNHLRVTVQLVKVADGYQLWSKNFDKVLEDIFDIQDDIATGVAQAMLDTLKPVKSTDNPDVSAYDYYLRGRQYFNRFRKLDMEYARDMFRHAIDIDPRFAQAWAGYADCHSFLVMYADPRESYREEASRASSRAVALEPELAEAHASRGLAYLVCEDFEDAETCFRRALELNPNLFEAYYFFGRARFHQGDMVAAAELFRKASEVNPADYQSRLLRVQILRGSGRLEEAKKEAQQAIEAVEKYLEWHPDDARARHLGAGSLILLGDVERANDWLQRAIEIAPNDSVVLYNVACNYATMGQDERALEYLDQAVRQGTISASWMRNDEDLASLRDYPAYQALLANLEQDKHV
jgi:TolB-like protein/Flp pilus assembly protein TadD